MKKYFLFGHKLGNHGTGEFVLANMVNRFKLVYKLFRLVKNYDLLILNDVLLMNIIWFVTRIRSVKYVVWSDLCQDEIKPNNNVLSQLFYKNH